MIVRGSFTLKQSSFRIKSFSCKVFDLPITQCVLSKLPSVFLYRTYMDSSHAGNHCGYSFIQRLLRKKISEYQNGTWKNLPGKNNLYTNHQFVWIPSQCPTNYPPKNYTTKLLEKWWKMTISFLGWHIFGCQVWRISTKKHHFRSLLGHTTSTVNLETELPKDDPNATAMQSPGFFQHQIVLVWQQTGIWSENLQSIFSQENVWISQRIFISPMKRKVHWRVSVPERFWTIWTI